MKRKALIMALLLSLAEMPAAVAQVADMRAISRQRGFKAYRAGNAAPAVSYRGRETENAEKVRPRAETAPVVRKEENDQRDQTAEFEKYIAENPHVLPDIPER